jgi:hypothetical protein
MKRNFLGVSLIAMFALVLSSPAPAFANQSDRLEFKVFLNDKEVGKHLYTISEADGVRRVRSEANFTYKILFIPAYRYEHSNSEQWVDDCLLDFNARTNANGKDIQASGELGESGFTVRNADGRMELPECVMSFAYWNPDFLDQPRLLNPQTGEYVEVSVEELEQEVLDVRGELVPALKYRLTAYEVDLTLWYSEKDQWLALESIAKGGHVIRYELS